MCGHGKDGKAAFSSNYWKRIKWSIHAKRQIFILSWFVVNVVDKALLKLSITVRQNLARHMCCGLC